MALRIDRLKGKFAHRLAIQGEMRQGSHIRKNEQMSNTTRRDITKVLDGLNILAKIDQDVLLFWWRVN